MSNHDEVERRIVRDDLNLPMLFLDQGTVVEHAGPRWPDHDHAGRHYDADIALPAPRSPAQTAALLCRVLHNPLIAVVQLDRVADSVRLRATYALSSGPWLLDLTATPPELHER